MWHDIFVDVIGGLILVGVTTLIVFGRQIVGLPREMIVVKAALFRLLRSNKLQGTALQKMALAIKQGSTNGEADDAVKAVVTDQNRTDAFFQKVALVHPDNLEDLLKEEE
jgi:hypothetical protein